ncbi:Hypoxia up-regulated protein 1 [Rhizoctonia solani]|uniref:Hypoxia up-regulated protein 1 n=1 Tax=Rhizoctonia solani TaxID=456999 RepID=A0A0K6FWS0_9AGAM|nr:Hypoxia up-regulated protein 1 [Rhizoctonia solani]
MAAKTSSRLRLVQNGAASTVSLAPIVEAAPTGAAARGQPVKCEGDTSDQSGQPILPDLSEGLASVVEIGPEMERDASTVETTGRSSGTTTTRASNSSCNIMEVDHMTPDDMFQHLIEHGCDDLTCSMDPEKYSSCRIDQGGFGDIWRGQFQNGLCVAVKVLRFALVADGRSKALKRMMREIYAWSKLDHENVHKLLGVTIHQGQLGMVSEWMTNGNLRNYLSRNPDVDRYKLCIQIAKAVTYIHDRDMANVLVSSDGVIKLTDFDYSLIPDCSLLFSDTTRIGCGTLRWMAPELVLQTSFQRSKPTDVYALGMTFLEVITGALPYHPQCHLDAQVIAKLVHKSFPERSTEYFAHNKRGDETWKLLTRCWDHDPAARPTAEAVLTWVSMYKVPSSLKSELIDRSYAKLAREAERIKAILSVNVEVNAGVEGLVGEKDFKTKVERKEFDKATEDLFWRFQQPMLDAIDGTGVGLADVESVILHGGTTRVPFVQTVLKSTVGSAKLATNVNADEACVLGTAFYGASLSRQFRTKPVKVQDAVLREVYLSYTAENKGKDGNPRTINTMVFPVRSATGIKKTLTLKRKQDFDVVVGFKELEPAGQPGANVPTLQYTITGVEAAYNNLTERGATDAAVKLTLLYSESGLATITEAAVVGTVKDDSLTGKLKSLFGGGSSSTTATESSTASASEETKVEDEPKEPVEKVESIPVTATVEPVTVKPMSLDEKKAARKRLVALNAAASTKREREEAFNNLEGFLYRLRRLLSDDSDESPFNGFSTPEERAKIEQAVDAAMEWLDGPGSNAKAKELWAKRDEIETMEKPIQHRYKEAETGPQALKDLQQAMFAAKLFVSSAQENRTKIDAFNAVLEADPEAEPEPLPPMAEFTEKEIKDVEALMAENEVYLNERVDVQKSLPKHVDPVLVTAEMNTRGMKLQSTVQKLTRRKPRARVAVKKTTTTATTTSEAKAEETAKEKVKDEL